MIKDPTHYDTFGPMISRTEFEANAHLLQKASYSNEQFKESALALSNAMLIAHEISKNFTY